MANAPQPKAKIEKDEKGELLLVIRIPVGKKFQHKSSSGKSYLVSSTGSFQPVPGSNLKLSLNVICPDDTIEVD